MCRALTKTNVENAEHYQALPLATNATPNTIVFSQCITSALEWTHRIFRGITHLHAGAHDGLCGTEMAMKMLTLQELG